MQMALKNNILPPIVRLDEIPVSNNIIDTFKASAQWSDLLEKEAENLEHIDRTSPHHYAASTMLHYLDMAEHCLGLAVKVTDTDPSNRIATQSTLQQFHQQKNDPFHCLDSQKPMEELIAFMTEHSQRIKQSFKIQNTFSIPGVERPTEIEKKFWNLKGSFESLDSRLLDLSITIQKSLDYAHQQTPFNDGAIAAYHMAESYMNEARQILNTWERDIFSLPEQGSTMAR